MRRVSQIFKALSEDTRLEILALLFRHGELCVCDVQGILGATQPEVAYHLRYLVATGLVAGHSDGSWMRYRIADDAGPQQAAVLATARALLADAPVAEAETRYSQWMIRKTCCPPIAVEKAVS